MNYSEKCCLICDAPLYGRADKTTCSDACRVRLHRQRQDDAAQETDEADEQPPTGHQAPLDLPWLTQQPFTYPEPTYLDHPAAQETNQQTTEQKHAREVALAKQLQQHYVKVVRPFLENEQHQLHVPQLRRMLERSIDAYKAYKSLLPLALADSTAQQQQKDLRDISLLLQETYQAAKESWLSKKSQYEVRKKWRRQLQERLWE